MQSSLINRSNTTFKSLFNHCIDNNHKIIITTKKGMQIIDNNLNKEEICKMRIFRAFQLGDNGFFRPPLLDKYDDKYSHIIFFVENISNIHDITETLKLCNKYVFIFFFTPVPQNAINDLANSDTKKQIIMIKCVQLSNIIISDHCTVNPEMSIFSCMINKPSEIVIEPQNTDYLNKLNLAIDDCVDSSIIFDNINKDILLIGLDRSYDELIYELTSSSYESLLHKANIRISKEYDHLDDYFFRHTRYLPYDEVIKIFTDEAKSLREREKEHKDKINTLSTNEGK